MSTAYLARTNEELEGLARDLPATQASVSSRRRPTRLVLALLGSSERDGRLRLRRRVACLVGLGNIDLDLRQATFDGDVLTVFAVCIFGAIDLYVPEGVEVDLHGLALVGHKGAHGNDPLPVAGTPLVRVVVIAIFAGIDVWRVPIAWAQKSWGDVIQGLSSGMHKELET
jgi:hypothetical protein